MNVTEYAKTLTRVVRIEREAPVAVGDEVTLVRWTDTMFGARSHGPASRREGWTLVREARTNMSHEIVTEGWMGTTNDISAEACGRFIVAALRPHYPAYAESDQDHFYFVATLRPVGDL